ncbi:MAG: hypothetical protein HYZ96_01080 [Candidatus Omnitrophica bacterium]|nr:hypothetical protein [Candidatus Omnitrophota bacterium]
MRLSHWVALIAVMVGIGFLRVSQRNALLLKGYAVGERLHRVHAKETDVTWLAATVDGLASPAHLAQVAEERRLKLVARSTLTDLPSRSDAQQPIQLASGDEMSD